MNIYLDVQSPAAQAGAGLAASLYGLENHGLTNLAPRLLEPARARALRGGRSSAREGQIASGGPLVVDTGKHTARAAPDKFVVREPSTEDDVWWGQYNRPVQPRELQRAPRPPARLPPGPRRVRAGRATAGADPEYRLPVRIVTEQAWHSLFARNMFLKTATPRGSTGATSPTSRSSRAPGFQATRRWPTGRGPRPSSSSTSRQKLCLIGGTGYAGEIKKSVFTVLNYLLPLEGVLSHALLGERRRRTATPRSSSGSRAPARRRSRPIPRAGSIGDDEHGWSDDGVFNFEDGCYAKVIRLSAEAEPQIYATHAPLRDGPRERRLRPGLAPPRPRRRAAHREHARRLPARLHRERGARRSAPATRRTSCS